MSDLCNLIAKSQATETNDFNLNKEINVVDLRGFESNIECGFEDLLFNYLNEKMYSFEVEESIRRD